MKSINATITDDIKSLIKNNRLYHGSSKKFDKILGSKTSGWTGDKGSIFCTPFPAIASCFVISKDKIIEELQRQGINTYKICFNYDVWDWNDEDLWKIPSHVTLTIDEPNIHEFDIHANGWIYTIDFSEYEGKSDMASIERKSDREMVIHGDVDPMYRTNVSVDFTIRSRDYKKPKSVDEMSDEEQKELPNDEVSSWRAMTGIELVHYEPDRRDFYDVWSNWKVMPDELKEESERKSLELFGKTNKEHFEDLDTQYRFSDVVSQDLMRLQDFQYGCAYSDGSIVTDMNEIKNRDGWEILVQSPTDFEKNKIGMCHDASVMLDKVLTDEMVEHVCVYMMSNKEIDDPTHSWIIAKDDDGKWWNLDVFSSPNCLFGNGHDDPKSALIERANEWIKSEDLDKSSCGLFIGRSFDKSNVLLPKFAKSILDNFKEMSI